MLYIFHLPVSGETYLFVGSSFPSILEEKSTGEFQGVGADIATEIIEGLGHTIEIKSYPWARAQRMIADGRADVIIGPYKTAERNKFMTYTQDHFYVDRIVFYVKKNSTFTWNGDFLSLKGHVIGTTIGWSYGNTFDQVKDSLTIESVKDLCTNFKKLVIGRVAIVPATYRNALACIKQFNLQEEVSLIAPDIQINKGYYGFSKQKKLTYLKKLFDERLQKMIENGKVSHINQTYQLKY
jgi:polar amino acid transport system substrate-binding protein